MFIIYLNYFREEIGNSSLASLVIPGTHNSGSFLLNDSYSAVANWVVCQDEDILSQLLNGIRFVKFCYFFIISRLSNNIKNKY